MVFAGANSGDGEFIGNPQPINEDNNLNIVPAEDLQRANVYALIARSLAGPMDSNTLDFFRSLKGHEASTKLGKSISALGLLAVKTHKKQSEEEFTKLFYGVGAGGELTPYASYYLTGLLYDKPLAELRRDMESLGLAPGDNNKEPEDHIASLCEIMHGLITGAYGVSVSLRDQKDFFLKHINPWASHFFNDLEAAKAAALYMPIGSIGKIFMQIEKEGFEMAA